MTTVNITTEIDSGLCGEEFDLNTDYVIAGELVMHTLFILSVCPSVRPSVGRSVILTHKVLLSSSYLPMERLSAFAPFCDTSLALSLSSN